ncbi:MAG: hypothetical protein IT245_03365 [Bacteroidia bacterium]|nr:hypothetical protein [Bacteroidia bacterium]
MKQKQDNKLTQVDSKKTITNIAIALGIALFVISFLPYIFTKWSIINFTQTGQIGDTIGGIMSPFIGIIGALLTFAAFWVQFQANQKQFEAIENEYINHRRQEIENRVLYYFDLLKDLKKDVRNEVGKYAIESSGKSFNYVLNETMQYYVSLRRILIFILQIKRRKEVDTHFLLLTDEDIGFEELNSIEWEKKLIGLSWHYSFTGVKRFGNQSSFFIDVYYNLGFNFIDFNEQDTLTLVLDSIDNKHINRLNRPIQIYCENNNIELKTIINNLIPPAFFINHDELAMREFSFSGNSELLSSYFQLFFHAVKLINKDPVYNYIEKYELVKIIRAQMSKEEMAIFFFNSLHEYGYDWEFQSRDINNNVNEIANPNGCLVTKYNLIKGAAIIEGLKFNPVDFYPDLIFSTDSLDAKSKKNHRRNGLFS